MQPRRVVDHQPRGLHVHRHFRQLELDALKLRDGLAELLALLGIGQRMIQRALRQPQHLRADADAPFVQRLDGDLVALADLAHHVLLGTRQSSRISSQVEEARIPSLSSFLPTWNPGNSRSTRNAVIPL